MAEVTDATTRPQPSGRLLTIGIPVFNGKTLLRNCLQSVINSTLPRDRFEIVIADDGSSEPETLAILEEFEKSLATDSGFFRVVSLGTNSGGAARPETAYSTRPPASTSSSSTPTTPSAAWRLSASPKHWPRRQPIGSPSTRFR